MSKSFKIASAGNVEPPIFSLLKDKGYDISINSLGYWEATKKNKVFIGVNVIELAGLLYLIDHKGEQWRVEDAKIDEFLDFIELNE